MEKINLQTPIACLTLKELMDALKMVQGEITAAPKDLPLFLTVPQCAELTGYSKTTINIKNSKHEIPGSKKLAGRVLFDSAVILDWINSGSVRTKSERLQSLEFSFKERKVR